MATTFSVQEHYEVPPARVFRALTNFDDADEWMAGLVRIDRLDARPLGIGCCWRETRRVFGREASEQFEVTELAPPTRLALRCDGTKGTSGRGEYLFDYTLEPADGGTRLTLRGEVRGLGGVWDVLGKLFAGACRKAAARDLAALRRHLDREVASAPGG